MRTGTVAHIIVSMEVGGAEVLLYSMALSMQTSGIKTVVFCLDTLGSLGKQLADRGVEVVCLGRRPGLLDFKVLLELKRLLLSHHVYLIHSHNFEANFYACMAGSLSGVRSLIHTQHGAVHDFSWKKRLIMQFTGRYISSFVGVSDTVNKFALDQRWVNSSKLCPIQNGVDTNALMHNPLLCKTLRQAHGIGEDDFVVVSVARLEPVKDHITLVNAFKILTMTFPRAQLILAGTGSQFDIINAHINALGISSNVKMLGVVTNVNEFLTIADVFSLASRYEGVSVALLEAMSMQCTPVVTTAGGNNDVVKHSYSGLKSDVGDTEGLAQNLLKMALNRGLCRVMGVNARTVVIDKYSLSSMLSGYVDLYRTVSSLNQAER